MKLTSDLSSSPAKDQTLFITPPTTHLPGMASATREGPAAHFPVPKFSPPVGKEIAGPTPQVNPLDFGA